MMLKFVSLFFILTVILEQVELKSYKGARVYELKVENTAQLQILNKLAEDEQSNYEFFSSPKLHSTLRVLVQPTTLKAFQNMLFTNHIKNQLLNDNFHATVEAELNTLRLLRLLKPYRPGNRLGTERFYNHTEINFYIEDLAQRYPKRVNVKTVGKSYEGRLMKAITITNGDGRKNKKVVLMDGGFHANEWIGPAEAVYAIGELVENYSANAELLLDYDWVILPVVNPDGYEYTQLSAEARTWRKTRQPSKRNGTEIECYGTDPNRNFGFHWNEEGASNDPCSNIYAGPQAFSEPETIVVRDLINTWKEPGVMYLTLHSYGAMFLHPWGWTSNLPDTWQDLDDVGTAGADAIKEATGRVFAVGSSTNVLSIGSGGSDDYAFNAGFPQSFTIELPAGGITGFDPPISDIDSYVKETWTGIRAMAKKIIVKYAV